MKIFLLLMLSHLVAGVKYGFVLSSSKLCL
jgi:hypothetical protein